MSTDKDPANPAAADSADPKGGRAGDPAAPLDFIRQIIADDLRAGNWGGRVQTRFPPEPNGYLHIGHAKSVCLNFGLAAENAAAGARCNLRFDDTNPAKEEVEYVESIKADIRWLGFDWEDRLFFASDYFDQLYAYAVQLIEAGKAYVCSLSQEAFKEYRGVPTRAGKPSPDRDRPAAESLDLFARMRGGEFEEGTYVLRAKIDMASPNLHLRDPALYRVKRAPHHRTGERWNIYPTYDFAHGLSDSIEGVTHSICTLEFEVHRPLYDWIIDQLGDIHHPRQIEFARLNLTHTVLSKRALLRLVEDGHVSGWDDPRMPTLSGLRRRGYTPEAIRDLCERVGVAKRENTIEVALLEHCVREDLNRRAPRAMAVLNPLKVVIENYPEDGEEELEAVNNPEDPGAGKREVPFARELYIEQDDFMEDPPRKFFRLGPGREVRLRYGYFITCQEVIKDADTGAVTELRCTYDPETRGGFAPDGRKVKGTLHWVSARHAVKAEVRLYEHLFNDPFPLEAAGDEGDALDFLNPESLAVGEALVEPSLAEAKPGETFQFERIGYFCADPDGDAGRPVFNRTVTLRDSWKKSQKPGRVPGAGSK